MAPFARSSAAALAAAAFATPALAHELVYVEAPRPARVDYYVPATNGDIEARYYYTPGTTDYVAPPIVVTTRPLTEDEAITTSVIATLASDPDLTGIIEVETRDNVVTLEGLVTHQGQSRRAERHAASAEGVREVLNHLQPRVGGSR